MVRGGAELEAREPCASDRRRGVFPSWWSMAERTAPAEAADVAPDPDRLHAAVREARDDAAPFALAAAGILVALALMWLGPSSALFASPFIPGSVLIGTGAASVIYEFLHRPRIAEFKRFCMHCGFPMTKIEIACIVTSRTKNQTIYATSTKKS